MNYRVNLNNGQSITLTNAQFNPEEFTASLNDQRIVFVNIGNAILNKHIIASIVPIVE